MNKTIGVVIAAGLLAVAWGAQAGDATAGKAKAMKCISCHGLKGVASDPQYPNIAGQKEAFLLQEMEAFKSGKRPVAAKTALFGGLSSNDFGDMAAHFSALPAGSAGSKADAAVLDNGKVAYAGCAGCHGTNAQGTDMGPRLAGQHAAYTIKRMSDYKSGAADHAMMKMLAANLSDDDTRAVAEYLASLK